MALALTPAELDEAIDRLAAHLLTLVEDYDESKYPTDAYGLLVGAFKNPAKTSDGDIERALRWKYGHWRKINYPAAQRRLAEKIARAWKRFGRQEMHDPESIYGYWMDALKGQASSPFITVTFLLHLLLPDQFPIMDQHTFRAMNSFLKAARPEWQPRQAPRNFTDLTTYMEFFNSLHTAWQSRDGTLTRSDLDKALMVFGQGLKRRALGKKPVGMTDWRGLLRVTDPARIERAGRPAKCPKCGHSPVAEILWGMPSSSPKLDEDLDAGRVALGGCIVSGDDPAWKCQKCGAVVYCKRPRRLS